MDSNFMELFKAFLALKGIAEETLSESERSALQEKLQQFIDDVKGSHS